MDNWLGLITDGAWGQKDRGPYIKQESESSMCTVYVDDAVEKAQTSKSQYKVALVNEPPMINTSAYDFLKENPDLFSEVFTYETGHIVEPECWVVNKSIYAKSKTVSAIFSNKDLNYSLSRSDYAVNNTDKVGYSLRHKIFNLFQNEIDIYGSISDKNPLGPMRKDKEEGVKDYYFHVIVENMWNGIGTEKITDACACGSVPIYWADESSPALKYYNKKGIILFKTLEELDHILKTISKEDYHSREPYIQENFEKACKLSGTRGLEFYLWDYLNLKKYMAKRED